MEELIKKFLMGYGDGDGDGNGNGYGNGNGNGYGDGDGNGYGDGDGDGNGYGDGDGDGYGYGNGYGDGYGNGNGDGDGVSVKSYFGNPVYYIDGIPCIFKSIKSNVAKVQVINNADFSTKPNFIYKFNYCFAHGETIQKAKEDAERKYYSQLDVSAKIAEFGKTFKKEVKYPAQLFYEWHTILTGSCDSGKNMFIQEKGISLESEMTTDEFFKIVNGAYGWNVIKELLN